MKYVQIILCIIFFQITTIQAGQQAVVCVPVADLVGSPLTTQYPSLGTTIADRYYQMPYCGSSKNGGIVCPRVHQLLFNEVVTVIAAYEHQACITIPHLFYVTAASAEPQNLYWTLKSNVMPLDTIKTPAADQKIPPPIDFKSPNVLHERPHILALTHPWRDNELKMVFSAGTRFMYNPENSTDTEYAAYILHPKLCECKIHFIPRSHCAVYEPRTQEEAQAYFVTLLKEWAHPKHGNIPYVWGGCSYSLVNTENEFKEITTDLAPSTQGSWYEWPQCQKKVKDGFDCAGLIARAAQLSGIPYYYKNTLTLSLHLDELSAQDTLQEGDLIWIPGHVMVISNLKNNLFIEARSYVSGYGIVHEIPLEHVFKDITTYEQLVDAFHHKRKIVRMDRTGKEVQKIARYKLLKMNSTWKRASNNHTLGS